MDESIEKMNANHGKKLLNPFAVKKPKKRSLVERELETNMTARITSPVTVVDGVNTSRYGRARRMKHKSDGCNISLESEKTFKSENKQTLNIKQVVNSPYKIETPKKALETPLDNIDNLYKSSKTLNHFDSKEVLAKSPSSAKEFPKVYIRKDLIQNRDDDDDVILIKDLFSPKSAKKQKMLEDSYEKSHSTKQNGFIDNASVVKALDFDDVNKGVGNKRDSDGNKRKRENRGKKSVSNEQFQVEATCPYQVGDLAWARMGTFPFWPCIITRDPASDMYVRKKLFGRVEHFILHVTFFADNGRRSWVVDNMLRRYTGLVEFLSTREKFTPEDKKKDPRLYAAFFISEKKQSLWDTSVEEAEMINREPKRLRIDIFNDILQRARASKKRQKSGKITRTDSDVSLSESLYDSLFSEDDSKTDDSNRSRNKSRNKSLDVSDVVTACLDNMAAKTGNIKIQRQSHMDRWLQKAKSKTPEKVKTQIEQSPQKKPLVTPKIEINVTPIDNGDTPKDKNAPKVEKLVSNSKKKKLPPKEVKITKTYSLRRSYESQNLLIKPPENNELKLKSNVICTKNYLKEKSNAMNACNTFDINSTDFSGIIPKTEPLVDCNKETTSSNISEDSSNPKIGLLKDNPKTDENDDDVLIAINELLEDAYSKPFNTNRGSKIITTEKLCAAEEPANNQVIKPELMDVEEYKENKVQDQSVLITENLVTHDSPGETEKEPSRTNHSSDCPVKIDSDSPVKNEKESTNTKDSKGPLDIENKSSTEDRLATNLDLGAKQTQISRDAIEISSDVSNTLHPTSPTLNSNEIVSISDNLNMTDDESKSMTALKINIPETKGLEDHNSNLTNKKCEKYDMSIDEITEDGITLSKKDVLNQSGESESILKINSELDDIGNEKSKIIEKSGVSFNTTKSESILDTSKNEEPVNSIENKLDIEKVLSNSVKTNPFLDDSRNIDCVDSATVSKEVFFRGVNMNKPPDLISDSLAAKADLLLNKESYYDEDSDDEPSPEYEPLGEEITEDFRQHMMCIESSLTDKKDEAQLAKVCNEIAIIEESKVKLADIISSVSKTSPKKSVVDKSLPSINEATRIVKEENIKTELSLSENIKVLAVQGNEISNETEEVKRENVDKSEMLQIDLTEITDKDISKEVKAEILDGLNIIKKSVENGLKSPSSIKKHKLSLKKKAHRTEDTIIDVASEPINDTVNLRYKTIDQIEEIMKNKPKRLPIENCEVRIPEIKESGYKIEMDTPDIEDDDFDIDNVSVNSEDSEVSIPQNKVPARRSLRSRPEKKGGLEDPEFLTYMELRQDDLMEEHPELTRDDIVLYLYKTYAYAQNLKSDVKQEESPLVKSIKEEAPTPSHKKVKKPQVQPKNTIENYFREKYKNAKKIDFEECESAGTSDCSEDIKPKREICLISPVDSGIGNSKDSNESDTFVPKTIDLMTDITKDVKVELINDIIKQDDTPKTPKRIRNKTVATRVSENFKISPTFLDKSMDKRVPIVVLSPIKDQLFEIKLRHNTETKLELIDETKHEIVAEIKHECVAETKHEQDIETQLMDSDSELPLRQLRSKVLQENKLNELKKRIPDLKDDPEETASISSENEPLLRLKPKKDKSIEGSYEDPEFIKYQELKQDAIIDDNPQLSLNEIKAYLYKTWIYEKDSKSDIQKIDEIESSNLVKGVSQDSATPQRKVKRRPKTEKNTDLDEIIPKEKPKRKTVSHYYNEAFISDIEDELEVFEIFKTKKTPVSKQDSPKKYTQNTETKTEGALKNEVEEICEEINTLDEIELYFKQLTSSKPSVFKGLVREKVCEVCEDISNLIKCKGCNGTFHYDCVNKVVKTAEAPVVFRGRKKKKKPVGRRHRNLDDSENSDERSQDVSEDNISMEETESLTIDAATLESQLEAKMREILEKETQLNYDSYSSDDGIDWTETVPGKCELVDVKLKRRDPPIDTSNFKCSNCQKNDTPVCFVCKSAVSKTDVKIRQKCNFVHCFNYYHLECLDHWPQTQFNAGEWSRSNKKANEPLEALTCPRHVCHTCVSDDPRGCKTRFSGDKLAKCVRCPATYHSFNKCLPAGTQILTASFIICPRHYEHRPGKVPCHVNTGWCFICALGGSLICCEYCPTSFHAECLNIKPPEGNYMCEDCETGRLPLYGEMVWVKLGHYRWWPGVILHPSEIPDNIMAVKHGLGEFVVRFFGQYDHYWVNRGRVFPYQEGDSGRISSQKSKIDAAFTTAMEHAQRAFEILKNAEPDDEESLDIASSLLPPRYVKLKCNKPIGSLLGRKIEDPSLSLTQCECNPAEMEPCGPNSQCLNRVLLTECGPTCRAGERCNNRAFEKRLYPKLTPYKAPHRGWGLKTLDDIKAGQFVIEYVGELIDEEEFQRRMRRKHEIRDENFYFLTLDKERMIDAGPKGNLARFMNHCCEPNTETQKWTVLGDVRVGLFAIDDIKANSEVTFNYNLECTGIEKKRCLCGAKRCSGYIGAKPKQLDESQRKKNCSLTGKRKYTKRKNIEESPSKSKNKVKKPLGRPPKPKELTEIEKDLLIIKSATIVSSDDRSPSFEDKNPRTLKNKLDSNTTEEVKVSNGAGTLKHSKTLINEDPNLIRDVATLTELKNSQALKTKLDYNPTLDEPIFNGTEPQELSKGIKRKFDSNLAKDIPSKETSRSLKRKLGSNSTDEAILSNGESAKRQKCDTQIEVGD